MIFGTAVHDDDVQSGAGGLHLYLCPHHRIMKIQIDSIIALVGLRMNSKFHGSLTVETTIVQ